ncbi:MAG TPA: thermonuclease family protein [Kofleriaceae bacterium]|nr:thermonuclease family protein [Kofleriaceae bacterium]
MRWALGALVLSSALAACGGDGPCGATEAVVTRVVDGDTIELDDGRKIRLLLVDTPETTGGHDDCYGTNAVTFTSDLVLNKTVQLGFDVECTDRYGRTLAYVTVDGQEVNRLIIQRGFGCVLHISPDGDSRVDEFKGYQVEAKSANRGLWGACMPLPPACT